MSALGQKRTCAAHKPMSAKCQKRTAAGSWVRATVLFCLGRNALIHEAGAVFHLYLLLIGSLFAVTHLLFCALSLGIIFSGAVAFIGPGTCADAVQAKNAAAKVSEIRNVI